MHQPQTQLWRAFGAIALVAAATLACGSITVGSTPPAQTAGSASTAEPTAAPVKAGAEGAAYATPEDAIAAYFDGVAKGNAAMIMQTCAINEMSEKFQFDLFVRRMGGYLSPVSMLAPSTSPLYVEANKAQLSSEILSRVKIFDYSLLSNEKLVDNGSINPISGMDAGRIDAFMKDVDPARLSSIKLEKIGSPDPTVMNSAKYKDNAAQQAAIYGADESTERVALFSFQGYDYFVGFSLLRYGKDWKISGQYSPLAGTSGQGAAEPTTPDDFQSLISH